MLRSSPRWHVAWNRPADQAPYQALIPYFALSYEFWYILMTRSLSTIFFCLLFTVLTLHAGDHRTVDARQFMTPVNSSQKDVNAQVTSYEHAFNLQHAAATGVFGGSETHLTLTNIDVPLHGTVTLDLHRTRPAFDATTKFMVNTPNGPQPFTVRPVHSYRGTVNGDPNTWVSLHYTEGDLTGFIQHADGTRTVVTRAYEMRSLKGATPHVLSDENSNGGSSLRDFTCGADDLPVDEKAVVTSMLMPSSVKKYEDIQLAPLKRLDIALVLREDIFTILERRGYDEERTAQHFAKIVAAMSQAYEEDLRTTLHISFLIIHTEDAPSGYVNDGADPGGLLEEFSFDWSSGWASVDRTLAHLYTVKVPTPGGFVGGIAYGGQAGTRLCVKDHRGAYGVSTLDLTDPSNMPGQPASRNAFVWDVFVAAHEIGHNVGSPHTHNCFWSPPVDTCQIQSDGTDACYNQPSLRRVRPGTIMSYCHLVNGSSTPLTFGPRVAERMRTWVDGARCMTVPPTPMVRITSPRGTETYAGGSKQTIKWVSSGVTNVNLHYSVNGGTNWQPIVGPVPAVDTQYVWTVPNVSTTNLLIRIQSAEDPSVENISIAAYAISVPLEFIAPLGGERLGIGYEFTVRFRKDAGISQVNIDLSTDDGASWNPVTTAVTSTTYTWTIPNSPTSNARLRIRNASNANIFDISQRFAIGEPTFKLLLPNEGANLCVDQDNQFNWNGDFIDRIRIQYSTDDGASWRNALQTLTVEVKQWEIFSRNSSISSITPGTTAKLQVVESVSMQVLDSRDNVTFTSCANPVSVGENETATRNFAIASVTPNPASSTVQVTINHAVPATVDVLAFDQHGASVALASGEPLTGSGSTVLNVPVSRLANGAYRLVIRAGEQMVDAPLNVVR
jgi:hypothetical protein